MFVKEHKNVFERTWYKTKLKEGDDRRSDKCPKYCRLMTWLASYLAIDLFLLRPRPYISISDFSAQKHQYRQSKIFAAGKSTNRNYPRIIENPWIKSSLV